MYFQIERIIVCILRFVTISLIFQTFFLPMSDLLNFLYLQNWFAQMPKGSNCSNVRIFQKFELLECSNCSMLKAPPKNCSKSPVPCKNSKFKNSKLRQSRNNSKFKIQNSKIILSPSPPRQCFCRTVRYVRASAYTWRQQTCQPLLCSRPVSGSRGSRPSRCRRSL